MCLKITSCFGKGNGCLLSWFPTRNDWMFQNMKRINPLLSLCSSIRPLSSVKYWWLWLMIAVKDVSSAMRGHDLSHLMPFWAVICGSFAQPSLPGGILDNCFLKFNLQAVFSLKVFLCRYINNRYFVKDSHFPFTLYIVSSVGFVEKHMIQLANKFCRKRNKDLSNLGPKSHSQENNPPNYPEPTWCSAGAKAII